MVEATVSTLPFDYETIRVTQSRINKGLLAIPRSLLRLFPKTGSKVSVVLGDASKSSSLSFTPYTSSSGECRIGGMRQFYEQYGVKDGDELVIQVAGDGLYRILPERQFADTVTSLEEEFDLASSESKADSRLQAISKATNTRVQETMWSEYYRLAHAVANVRKRKVARVQQGREDAPPSVKRLLSSLYDGKCQLTGFGFLTKRGKPYFETHHIRPDLGHHVKNILLVCPNCHVQFTHARVEQFFDDEGWLRRVKFNDTTFQVNQAIDRISGKFRKETHSAN